MTWGRWLLIVLVISPGAHAAHHYTPEEAEIGPTLVVGLPHPLMFAIDGRNHEYLSAGIGLGNVSIPLGKANDEVTSIRVGISNVEVRGRVHPFGGTFFLGAILGSQDLYARAATTVIIPDVANIPLSLEAKIQSGYLTPHLGWFWVLGQRFRMTLGLELGVQLPFSAKSSLDPQIGEPTLSSYLDLVKTTEPYRRLEADLVNAGNRIGLIKLPYAAIRLGWMF